MKLKSKMLLLILAFLMCSMVFAACAGGGSTETSDKSNVEKIIDTITGFKLGDWENNVYTNEKFDLKVSLPAEWYVFTTEELEEVFGQALSDLENTELELDEGDVKPLFFVVDNPDFDLAQGNMNLTATRSLLAPDLEEEYSEEALSTISKELEQYGEVVSEAVGEVEFCNTKAFLVTMNTAITGTDLVQYQRIYQIHNGGYLLSFTLTALDETYIDDTIEYIQFN